jgi:threonine synthase
MSIWRYDRYLPNIPAAARVTLGEGDTPLVLSRRIGPSVGLERLYLKLDGCNPTGSFKDRFAVTAVSAMVAAGSRQCLATSSGNTGAALAGYCAAAGIACNIAIVETAPVGKLRQMMAYGARIFKVRQFGLRAQVTGQVMDKLRQLSVSGPMTLQISAYRYSPVGMQGVQTLAHELAAQLSGDVGHVFAPAGGGGLVVALGAGFRQLIEAGECRRGPAVHCVQPEGNATIAGPLREGQPHARAVECTSHISGLQVPNVIDGDAAIEACRATGGTGQVVSDAEVYAAQQRLAREEGIFTEPAGAVALAGALAARRDGLIRHDEPIVCLVTGLGFKDEASIIRMTDERPCPLLDGPDEIERFLSS